MWWKGTGIGDATVARQEIGLDYKVESASDLKPTTYRFKRPNVLMFFKKLKRLEFIVSVKGKLFFIFYYSTVLAYLLCRISSYQS